MGSIPINASCNFSFMVFNRQKYPPSFLEYQWELFNLLIDNVQDGSYSRGPVDIPVGDDDDSKYYLSPTFKFEQVSFVWHILDTFQVACR